MRACPRVNKSRCVDGLHAYLLYNFTTLYVVTATLIVKCKYTYVHTNINDLPTRRFCTRHQYQLPPRHTHHPCRSLIHHSCM